MEKITFEKHIKLKSVIIQLTNGLRLSHPYKKRQNDMHSYEGKEILDVCNKQGYFNLGQDRDERISEEFKGKVTDLEYKSDNPGPREDYTILSFQEFLEVGKKQTLLKKITDILE